MHKTATVVNITTAVIGGYVFTDISNNFLLLWEKHGPKYSMTVKALSRLLKGCKFMQRGFYIGTNTAECM